MGKNRRSYEYVGSFALTQPKMLVSDPGYDKGEWCSKTVDNCEVGDYDAYINVNHYRYENGQKDKRVASLFVKHSSAIKEVFGTIHCTEDGYIRWKGKWESLSSDIGVDSGQAGFFDYSKYGDNSQFKKAGKCGFGDKWYSNCCDTTLNGYAGIVAKCGVNASSGFGDGCYAVFGHKSKNNKIDAMALFFLADDDPVEF